MVDEKDNVADKSIIGVTVDSETMRVLLADAAANERSASAQVRYVLKKYYGQTAADDKEV